MTEKKIVVDLFYLPPIEFFVALQDYEVMLIERQENYQKQSYRNRAAVRLANKVEFLSVPVIGGNKKTRYAEIQIDESQRWKNVHLGGIKSGYGNAPYFDYFYPELEQLYHQKHRGLYDLNYRLLTLCLELLQLNVKMEETTNYGSCTHENDIRGVLNAKQSYESRNIYRPYPYTQLFGLNFAPNLSIIDLLFCEGPNSKIVIDRSKKEKEHYL
jgi:hypothetical protein